MMVEGQREKKGESTRTSVLNAIPNTKANCDRWLQDKSHSARPGQARQYVFKELMGEQIEITSLDNPKHRLRR
jgi:hypothetical protein